MACKYKNCKEPVNLRHDDELCVFHAPKERKGITVKEFNKLIREKIEEITKHNEQAQDKKDKEKFNFSGFIFPGDISFTHDGNKKGKPITFNHYAYFSKAQFLGNAYFSKAQFSKEADFHKARFSKEADFRKAQFSGKTAFSEAQFSGEASFSKAQFSGSAYFNIAQFSGFAYFSEAQFSGYTDFSGAKFSGNADFSEAQFSGEATFGEAQFSRFAFFSKAQFPKEADFIKAQFSGEAHFSEAQFSGNVYFSEAQFSGSAYFSEAQFSGEASFSEAQFLGYASFREVQFSGEARFHQAQFSGKTAFINAKFLNKVYFFQAKFSNAVGFKDNEIKHDIDFTYITLDEKSVFYFLNPRFLPEESNDNKNETIKIIFDQMRFNPFTAYFENIKPDKEGTDACLIFRYCQLKDVYFTNNDMSLFSFYKSSFDQARFISNDWSSVKDYILLKMFKFNRNNVIAEEKFLEEINKKNDEKSREDLKKKYDLEGLNGYEDVSSLYRQMKTALDNTKDYQEASKFYFNEFEMKRKALKENIKIEKERLKKFFMRGRLLLYNMYKTFAGYGEKPLWSFLWFGLGVLGFTILNYCLGFKKGIILEGGTIDTLDATFWDSFIFTLYRIIPANYLPYKQIYDIPDNFWGMLIPFLNTAVLILFIAFIAIGLKRHFRRF